MAASYVEHVVAAELRANCVPTVFEGFVCRRLSLGRLGLFLLCGLNRPTLRVTISCIINIYVHAIISGVATHIESIAKIARAINFITGARFYDCPTLRAGIIVIVDLNIRATLYCPAIRVDYSAGSFMRDFIEATIFVVANRENLCSRSICLPNIDVGAILTHAAIQVEAVVFIRHNRQRIIAIRDAAFVDRQNLHRFCRGVAINIHCHFVIDGRNNV